MGQLALVRSKWLPETRCGAVLFACGILLFLWNTCALAQPAVESQSDDSSTTREAEEESPKQQAAEKYREARVAYAEGDFQRAIELFRAADSLMPSSALSYNIARAYDSLQDVGGSLYWYSDYLVRAPNAPDRAEVERLIQEREQQLAERGVQQLRIRSKPSGATVLLGESEVGTTPWYGQMAPGVYPVTLVLPGRTKVQVQATLEATHAVEMIIELPVDDPVPAVAPPVTAEQTKPPPASSLPPEVGAEPAPGPRVGTWTWVLWGAGTAGLAGAVGFELARASAEERAATANEDEQVPQVEVIERFETMESRQTTARILAGVGGGLLLAGGVLFFLENQEDEEIGASIGCGPSECGAVFRGSF